MLEAPEAIRGELDRGFGVVEREEEAGIMIENRGDKAMKWERKQPVVGNLLA